MRRFIWSTLFVTGIAIALLGIGIDFLLPGTSPGVNLPQLLIVAFGLALALLAARFRRSKLVRGAVAGRAKLLATFAIVTLATLLVLEIVLAVWGMPTYFHAHVPEHDYQELPWWTCDDSGCHYVYEEVQTACAAGDLSGRYCQVNRQGYANSDDFAPIDAANEQLRILLLGDSFTWGMSADYGMSFAERLTADLPQMIVWNAGIHGTGTNQALATFKTYAPQLRPHLTVLGFFENDFDDNYMPVDSTRFIREPDGTAIFVRKYRIDEYENLTDFDLNDRQYVLTYKQKPPTTEFERGLGLTRLGTLLLRVRDGLDELRPTSQRFERRIEVTRQYLRELREAAAESGSELLVLLIPLRDDVRSVGPLFQIEKQLMQELEIPFVDPTSILDPIADYAGPGDGHWSNAGHQKIGKLLAECIRRFDDSGSLADCEKVTIP